MKISEVFYSFQGEGTEVGKPNVFIRTFGCNILCSACDTAYASKKGTYKEYSIPSLVREIKKVGGTCKSLVITGGEPLIQKDLADFLIELFPEYWVTVETNCTIYNEKLLSYVDLWSVSPKLEGMGKVVLDENIFSEYLNMHRRGGKVQFKFVIKDKKDLVLLSSLLTKYSVKHEVPILVQPNTYKVQSLRGYFIKCRWLAEQLKKDFKGYDIRMVPQLHRILYWKKRRGV